MRSHRLQADNTFVFSREKALRETECSEKLSLIVTGEQLYGRVARCYTFPAELIQVDNPHALSLVLKDHLNAILLLDLALFDNEIEHTMVKTLLKKGFEQRIVVMTEEKDPTKLYPLMEQGVRGLLEASMNDDLLVKAIQAIQRGEFWIGRQLVNYMLSRLMQDRISKTQDAKSTIGSKVSLTVREEQIATYVAQGKCDKLIARDLNISPNTVKNHLQNIFRKLEVNDRYQLALIYHGLVSY